MPPRTREGSAGLADAIKRRRHELGLSAEEAARRAGVGTKTWFRYESGSSIRNDKVKGVCKALSWPSLPMQDDATVGCDEDFALLESIDGSHEAWSPVLAEMFGRKAAVSFAVGSDILLDYLNEDLGELAKKPAGSHLGELPCSWVADYLPQQFLTRYTYEFVFRLRAALAGYRMRVHYGREVLAHTPAEELLVRLIRDFSFDSIEEWAPKRGDGVSDDDWWQETEGWRDWPEDLCDDDDLSTCLDDMRWVDEREMYHFDRWFEPQFYLDRR
ncbi:MAG TPA: helix-turn-helix domain-containing protein [Candidatus Olsenella pullistercoris]|uniref:Helix-turn-helix domain-containing protein n=1 Tax=Candidatus Olsenella pullistercoris TaxID=2838712 RepID=A0A9D2F0L1_9ACTN|nr:helix-turn-helix domain-containing protein [Candidatus Olsenella pullistercoris]